MPAYITDIAAFLPNAPVSNDEMEGVLGLVDQVPSRTRRIILRNNRIKSRYYAIDAATGETTHTNAQLTAEAVRGLHPWPDFSPEAIECLCCGTSTPDQLLPGHGPMVHGELKGKPCEIMSAAGVCTSGMISMKYAWMSVASGQSRNAVATGSELVSTFIRASLCGSVDPQRADQIEERPTIAFEADFLRWMLSDGAGAAFITDQPSDTGPSLRIDWIDILSFAHDMEPCMYAGADKLEDGTLRGWREQPSLAKAAKDRTFLVKQDVKLLNQEVLTASVERTLPILIEKHGLDPDSVDWFLPHYSSDYFRTGLHDHMVNIGFDIPFERWFTNLTVKGNTGSASIYIMLEELLHSGSLKRGDKLLCFIPESGRFSICYMQLTVV